jgi:hypothetical protein
LVHGRGHPGLLLLGEAGVPQAFDADYTYIAPQPGRESDELQISTAETHFFALNRVPEVAVLG